MICQVCGKKQATFHYSSNENGNITETHLCHECAKQTGLLDDSNKIFNSFAFSDSIFEQNESMLSDLLGGMLGSSKHKTIVESTVCPFCGMRLNELMQGGKAGCAKCYTTFKNAISPTLQKLHGHTKHIGKIPEGTDIKKTKKDKRSELEALLNEAVQKQEYEKAAEYRDQIRELDNEQ